MISNSWLAHAGAHYWLQCRRSTARVLKISILVYSHSYTKDQLHTGTIRTLYNVLCSYSYPVPRLYEYASAGASNVKSIQNIVNIPEICQYWLQHRLRLLRHYCLLPARIGTVQRPWWASYWAVKKCT